MNALETAIEHALDKPEQASLINKAYLEFIKANFIIPIETSSTEEAPHVLYLVDNQQCFLPVFTNMTYFNTWAHEISESIQLLKLSGVDLLKGIGDDVIVCLNIGSSIYKEFNPGELARLKSMVVKLFGPE